MILNEAQRTRAVNELNELVDIPRIGERFEAAIIRQGVKVLEGIIEDVLPEEVLELLALDDGLTQGEFEQLVSFLLALAAEKAKLPFINSGVVQGFAKQVIDIILSGLKQGSRLED
jgi:hypothetical protein